MQVGQRRGRSLARPAPPRLPRQAGPSPPVWLCVSPQCALRSGRVPARPSPAPCLPAAEAAVPVLCLLLPLS
eukprot:221432-Chlamydomonas_euryale.AAC.1